MTRLRPRFKGGVKNKKEGVALVEGGRASCVADAGAVKATGARVCVVFEGVDSAGKGGTIRRITERTSPRVFKHIALPAPDERVKSQMYIQRYVAHFPAAGEVVIFDRSWYNRAGVEPVMGYCTPEQTERFLQMVPLVEKAMVDDGIILIKYFLNVSRDEQTRRLESRIDDPRKIWKLSPTDLKSLPPPLRLPAGPRRDVRRHQHGVGAVAHRGQRRQEARPAQHHLPPAQPDPVRAAADRDVKMPKPPSHDGYVEPESSRPNIPTPFVKHADRESAEAGAERTMTDARDAVGASPGRPAGTR